VIKEVSALIVVDAALSGHQNIEIAHGVASAAK
jgi:hypothetical protein